MRKLDPLHWRIDPKLKKLDQLDRLEAELKHHRREYDDETYYSLQNSLIRQKNKLTNDIGPKWAYAPPSSDSMRWAMVRHRLHNAFTQAHFKALLVAVVLIWLFS